jgi:hypothetical protein
MKIKPEHLKVLKEAIQSLDTPERRQLYREGKFPLAHRVKDLDLRYRWDLLYASRFDIGPSFYEYMNDEHIDTALRSFIQPLEK